MVAARVHLLYHEMTHDSPAAFFYPSRYQEAQILIDQWLTEHPMGKVVVVTLEQFKHTVFYSYFKEKGWELPE